MLKTITELLVKNRVTIVQFLILTLSFHVWFVKNGFAIQGYTQSDGTCLAYRWSENLTNHAVTQWYRYVLTWNDGVPALTVGDRFTDTSRPWDCATWYGVSYQVFKWTGTTWLQIAYKLNYGEGSQLSCGEVNALENWKTAFPNTMELENFFNGKGIPQGSYPSQYWSNGPPTGTNCGIPKAEIKNNQGPPCEPGQCCQ